MASNAVFHSANHLLVVAQQQIQHLRVPAVEARQHRHVRPKRRRAPQPQRRFHLLGRAFLGEKGAAAAELRLAAGAVLPAAGEFVHNGVGAEKVTDDGA